MPTKQSKSRPKDKTFLVVGPLFFRSSLLSLSRETTALLVFADAFGWRFFDLSSFRVFSFSARTSVSVFVALVAQRSLFFDLFGLFLWSPPRVVVFFTSGKTQKIRERRKKTEDEDIGLFLSSSSPFPSTQRTTPRDARRRRQSSSCSSSSRSVVARRFFFFRSTYMRGRRALVKKATMCVSIRVCILWGVSLLSRKIVKTLRKNGL